jgi:hypothetical protein
MAMVVSRSCIDGDNDGDNDIVGDVVVAMLMVMISIEWHPT